MLTNSVKFPGMEENQMSIDSDRVTSIVTPLFFKDFKESDFKICLEKRIKMLILKRII
ncbi:MAG: hypothetical protein WCJ95_16250 [Mariniphaga sp.]